MPIVLSDHAKRQLEIRKISEEMVIQTVRAPQNIVLSFRDRKLRQKQKDQKLL